MHHRLPVFRTYRDNLDSDHILYELLAGFPDAHRKSLKFSLFVSAAWRLQLDLSELDIRQHNGLTTNAAQST